MKIELTPDESKAIIVALIAKEHHHFKMSEMYAIEKDHIMRKLHFEQYCLFSDLQNKISNQIKMQS